MSKLKQIEINLDLNEEVHNWKLVREGDAGEFLSLLRYIILKINNLSKSYASRTRK
jgi:hypothetical protein